jgi:ATP-dependent HslUV protease subunit HslV
MKPVWDGKQFQPRLTLPLSLSYDHRVIDGASAARFNAYLGKSWRTSAACFSAMTTVVVVKKAGQIAIAADSLVTFGDTRLSHRAEDNTKIFKVDTRRRAQLHRHGRHRGALPGAAQGDGRSMPREILLFGSKDEIFDTFTKLHPYLKDNFFLQTKEEDSEPYESSQFSVVIANASGIYGIYSYREVFEFKEFWGIGSGRSFALGAMHAAYDKVATAREVAEAGIAAGCEFDRNSAPHRSTFFTLKLKVSK